MSEYNFDDVVDRSVLDDNDVEAQEAPEDAPEETPAPEGDVQVALRRRSRYTDSEGHTYERGEVVSVSQEEWEKLSETTTDAGQPLFERV